MMNKIDIKSLNTEELQSALEQYGVHKFRANQIYKWLHCSCVDSFDEMSNIPQALRNQLKSDFIIKGCRIERRYESKIDETVKYLFKLYDDELIESVLMKYKYGYTLCVSNQVGCKMGCKFCASTLNGCVRSLSASEILSQVYTAQKDRGIRISHIVLMGMGEPLDNFDNTVKFLQLITDENGQNLSMRNITLSTCGIVPKIKELEKLHLGLTLSVSLHAPNDEIRSRTMPINNVYNIEEVLNACKSYAEHTSRRVSFEYAMINGVNDSAENARELGMKLKGMLCHVNLIPVNEIKENSFSKSSDKRIKAFIAELNKFGINATVRRSLGSDINASCGQLRQKHIKEAEN